MPLCPCHHGAALLAAVAVVLCFTPAQAQRPALEISSPAPGGVRTVVTGQGAAASVAWPYGPATMTPLWLVSQAPIGWNCPGSKAVSLEVKTDIGPGAKPRTFELLRSSGLQGGGTTVELYLWEVSAVKAACAKEGEATVDSVSVEMTLLCEGGQRFGHTQRIPLKVDCKPSTPSQEAVTGLTGSEGERPQGAHSVEMLMKLSRATVDVSPTWLSLGKSGTLEFYSLLKRVWAPEIQRLRVVRLDEKGQVAERFQPVPLSGSESSPEFKPRLTFTPKAAGTARFALEAEYADGSRVLTQSAEVQILTPAQEAARKAKEISVSRRMEFFGELEGKFDSMGCSPKLVEWLKAQSLIEEAGLSESNVWYRFIDGQHGVLHCH